MRKDSVCTICSVFEKMQLPSIGNLLLMVGSVLAVFSLFAWPLLFVWPLLFLLGFALAAGHGACTECRVSFTG